MSFTVPMKWKNQSCLTFEWLPHYGNGYNSTTPNLWVRERWFKHVKYQRTTIDLKWKHKQVCQHNILTHAKETVYYKQSLKAQLCCAGNTLQDKRANRVNYTGNIFTLFSSSLLDNFLKGMQRRFPFCEASSEAHSSHDTRLNLMKSCLLECASPQWYWLFVWI